MGNSEVYSGTGFSIVKRFLSLSERGNRDYSFEYFFVSGDKVSPLLYGILEESVLGNVGEIGNKIKMNLEKNLGVSLRSMGVSEHEFRRSLIFTGASIVSKRLCGYFDFSGMSEEDIVLKARRIDGEIMNFNRSKRDLVVQRVVDDLVYNAEE